MPAIVLMFGLAIKVLMGYAVVRLLLALGLSYVTYQGMDSLIENMQGQIEGDYASLWENIFAIVTLSGADVALSILFSAIAIRMVLVGFQAGAKSGLRFKLPTGT